MNDTSFFLSLVLNQRIGSIQLQHLRISNPIYDSFCIIHWNLFEEELTKTSCCFDAVKSVIVQVLEKLRVSPTREAGSNWNKVK
jgi:hypothetical protein